MAVPARCKLGPKRSRPILGGGITERKYEPISCTPFLPFSDDMCHLRLLLDLTQRIEAPDGRLDSVWIVGVLHPDSVYHPPIAIPPGGSWMNFIVRCASGIEPIFRSGTHSLKSPARVTSFPSLRGLQKNTPSAVCNGSFPREIP